MINGERAVHTAFHQLRNLCARLEPTKGRSFPNASRHQLEGTSGNFVSRSGDSNDTTGAPSTMGAFQGGTHHLHISSAVKTVIDSPGSELPGNVLLNRRISKLFGVDEMSRAKLFCHFEFLRVNIDGDDLSGTGMLGTLNDCQTNSAEAEDSHRRVGFHLASVPNSSKSSRNTASKQAHLLEWGIWVDLGTRNLCQNGVFAHGGAAHEMENIFSVLVMESDGTIWHDALSLGRSNLGAEVGLWGLTKDT
mmetsp:Transcript_9949/g.28283  ORF Transcript_9949/g.28283 Transcript_9949/m.28283 type:complete len:249 (-) Transcript_9949:400-1146(-)